MDLPEKLAQYIQEGFPPAEQMQHGDTNEICRLCGEWVVNHSICAHRYHMMQGEWVSSEPEFDPRVAGDPQHHNIALIPICDKCADGLDAPSSINVMGYEFALDAYFRAND